MHRIGSHVTLEWGKGGWTGSIYVTEIVPKYFLAMASC